MASLARIGNKLFLRNGLPVVMPPGGVVDFACCCPYFGFFIVNCDPITVNIGVGSVRQTTISGGYDSSHQFSISGPCGTSNGTIGFFSQGMVYERVTTFSGVCPKEGDGTVGISYSGPANGYAVLTYNGQTVTVDANNPHAAIRIPYRASFSGSFETHLQ